ncbi:hypothetical protein [Dehalobacterium formicoaceticum]|uniref:DUF1440 domain-containing protein n=1 Tax=Dehalobacterium formicoaceticum TaxID=51515 RepID=A0ABT1Y0K0_9FIRM|nr:hypothetical protein [Dehalobacterium formicoaceticum]MCR6544392.1 hypothetical protein [Dehalobacterium formicoaceticum]
MEFDKHIWGETMDRTICGLLAGIIAGIAMNTWNLFDYYVLHLTEIRFLDWFSVLQTWAKPENGLQAVISLILQTMVWDGFLGIVFAHLVVLITSKAIVYKSALYSALLWFTFKVIINICQVPFLSGPGEQPFSGRMSNLLAIFIWGIVLGLVLKKLDQKIES